MDAEGRICVALDTDKARALDITEGIASSLKRYALGCLKVNRLIDQEATGAPGLPLFPTLAKYALPVWADVKLIDIPRTVVGRMKPYVDVGVRYVSVMADGDVEMMRGAVKCGGNVTSVIAVTRLTSLYEEDVHLSSGQPTKASVIYLARLAVLAGVRHIVCSGQELNVLRRYEELYCLKPIVPAIRPAWSQVDTPDQKRIMTPAEAIAKGASMIVIGSPIVEAGDPVVAFNKTVDEIECASGKEER